MISRIAAGGCRRILQILAVLAFAGPGSVLAMDVQDVCRNITEDQRELYGILEVTWVPAGTVDKYWPLELTTLAASPPAIYPSAYCRIVFTLGERGAKVSLDGGYVSFIDGSFVEFKKKQPWLSILRVSENYDGARTLIEVPSGGFSFVSEEGGHLFWRFLQNMPTAYVTTKPLFAFFSPDCADPLEDPCPQFTAPNQRPQYYLTGIKVVADRTRNIMALFGGTQRLYGYGGSQGALSFFGPYSDHPAIHSFDGLVVRAGTGYTDYLRSSISYCSQPDPRHLPLTGLTFVSGDPCNTTDYALAIRTCDRATSDAIFGLLDAAEMAAAFDLFTNYDPFNQPVPAGTCWDDLRSGGELQLPMIYLQGILDRTVPVHDGVFFQDEIIQAGKDFLSRFYYIRQGNHPLSQRVGGFTSKGVHETALRYLADWVENGVEPGAISYRNPATGQTSVTPTCQALGFGNDACSCFNVNFGSAVCTNPPPAP